jgi:uroporphyrin-III C-methyltransferase
MNSLGIVYLVGAGPGDPELITVRGLKLLQEADVVVYDRLVSRDLLTSCRDSAELIDVGKQSGQPSTSQDDINSTLVDQARRGNRVVRLKGGDPFVFGRGGEELNACVAAGIKCVIVPGVTSAIAAPTVAGIPVTHRGRSRSFAVVTAVTDDDAPAPDFTKMSAVDTIVVMMGVQRIERVANDLITAGRNPESAVACIENATTPQQRVSRTALRNLAKEARKNNLKSPAVLVIGPTVDSAR